MTAKPTVIIAGITGMLGLKIALAIVQKGVMDREKPLVVCEKKLLPK